MTIEEFEIFAKRCRTLMLATACNILHSRDEAEDIVQEVLLKLFTIRDKIDDNTSTLDRVLIYAAIFYTILPMDLLPSVIYKFLGVLDDGVAILFVYKKIKDNITPEINRKVEDTLNDWFGVEYELIEC